MTNPHLSDPSLRPFLHPTFSPVDYLNSTLPSLTGGAPTTTKAQPAPSSSTTTIPPLSTLTSQTQSHISALTAQQTRLTTTLTTLTDEILRTSSRLAYEVELLRGEAVSLADALSQRGVLGEAIGRVVGGAGGLSSSISPNPSEQQQEQDAAKTAEEEAATAAAPHENNEPAALPRLRTLHTVRSQLQSVIQTFNIALAFPMPPSMLTTTASSLVSITSPDADPDAERKGQVALAKLKGEVVDLLRAGDTGGAKRRVEELRGVCAVWKGTGEERARGRWVEGLEGLVEGKEGEEEERERERERREQKGGGGRKRGGGREEGVAGGGSGGGGRQTPVNEKGVKEAGTTGGGGFLRRLRDEIYLD